MTTPDDLRALPRDEWVAYLTANSGLPGPRANLALVGAFAEAATPAQIHRAAGSPDEYLALCGAAGLGRLLAEGEDVAAALRGLAGDDRWRVREGVAMGLQRLGDADPDRLLALAAAWAEDPSPLVRRAAVAGVCEPRLVRRPATAAAALELLDRVTATLTSDADGRVLRKALGYCWSVAVAALPDPGFDRLERWADRDDPEVRWVVRENLRKARLAKADAGRTAALRALVG
jgi:HEAT repeat protein